MEPWVYDTNKNWGVKTWGKWSNPDPKKFLHVRKHSDYLNPAQWFFPIPQKIQKYKMDKIIAIVSDKLIDTGHIQRVELIKYIESFGVYIIDVYGYENYHNFQNYKGKAPSKIIMENYKYVFSAENNNEYNYATEKIWEPIIVGSLCFYSGCPNLNMYIDNKSFISINLEEKHHTMQLMMHAIENDWWKERLPYILKDRKNVIEQYNILEIINNIVDNDN